MSQIQFSRPGAAKTAHLFVDASNVNVMPHQIPALDAIARDGFSRFATALVVGSTEGPSQKPAIWSNLGYQVKFSERHGQPESAFNVDCTIVSQMLLDILEVHDPTGKSRVRCTRDLAEAVAAALCHSLAK